MNIVEWKHNKIFNDWTLSVQIPLGRIEGLISFTNPKTDDYTVWGTIESKVGGTYEITTTKYRHPSEAIETMDRSIISVMAGIITDIARIL